MQALAQQQELRLAKLEQGLQARFAEQARRQQQLVVARAEDAERHCRGQVQVQVHGDTVSSAGLYCI